MKNVLKLTGLLLFSMVFAVSCSEDDGENSNSETYNTTFKITDAPIDNANVSAVFVTVTDVKLDGKSLEGFTATTIELSALVNGKTQTLGNLDLTAKTYSSLELVLDYEKDVQGNAPGCYVEMANGEKQQLESSANSIKINDSFEVVAATANTIIIDFDLRKSVVESEASTAGQLTFATAAELGNAIRTVNEEDTGTIKGSVDKGQDNSDKIIVYAYKKGTFNAETETQGSGSSNVTFSNAVTSAEVSGLTNAYSLNFVEEGEYELVFVGYNENQNSGNVELAAILEAESSTGLNLGALSLTSALQLNVNVTITGSK